MDKEKNFISLIEKNKGIILKIIRIYQVNAADQLDLSQEIIYQLWKSYPSFQKNSSFSTWMYRVAINTALTFMKQTIRRKNLNKSIVINELEEPVFADELQSRPDELSMFYNAVQELNEIEKAIIFYYLEELNHKEIGKNLGISEENARVKLHRTKEKLQKNINNRYYGKA